MTIPQGAGSQRIYVTPSTASGLQIFSGAGPNFPALETAYLGDVLEALDDPASALAKIGQAGQWLQVINSNGSRGWVDAELVSQVSVEAVLPGGTAAPVGVEIDSAVTERIPLGPYVWSQGHALVGLHGPTEAWPDRWDNEAFQILSQARIQATKLLASPDLLSMGEGAVTNILQRLQQTGVKFAMARLFAKFDSPKTAQDFVREVGPAAKALFANGMRYYEVHNEPNLNIDNSREGMFVAWQDGRGFARFFIDAVALLKAQYDLNEAKFGFPGLSPVPDGGGKANRMVPMNQFLTEATEAVKAADFLCMHTYWQGTDYSGAIQAVKAFCEAHSDKLVIVSEFANTDPNVNRDAKGRQYADFYEQTKQLPSNLGAVLSYAMKSAGDYGEQLWAASNIPSLVGGRSVV